MKHWEKCEKFLKDNGVNCCTTIDTETEGSFSWSGCDCCKNRLGQTVYECHGYSPTTNEVVELGDVCQACLCYFANGEDIEEF